MCIQKLNKKKCSPRKTEYFFFLMLIFEKKMAKKHYLTSHQTKNIDLTLTATLTETSLESNSGILRTCFCIKKLFYTSLRRWNILLLLIMVFRVVLEEKSFFPLFLFLIMPEICYSPRLTVAMVTHINISILFVHANFFVFLTINSNKLYIDLNIIKHWVDFFFFIFFENISIK